MKNETHHTKVARLCLCLTLLFVLIAGAGLLCGTRYIRAKLLQSDENAAMDLAQLVRGRFSITDAEVAYMKSLTFNQMEVDPINLRLMRVVEDETLNAHITNVYLVAPLAESEIKYTIDNAADAEFFGYELGTPLGGIWLLNGILDEDGCFVPTERADICRYTSLSSAMAEGMNARQPFGEFSSDAWGTFITGYAPVYTLEGSFVGLLGIDMDPDKFQAEAQSMVIVLFAAFGFVSLTMMGLFLFFYFKYIKAREGQLYFDFYSRMSHDMRTPMNGILGLALLARDEHDVESLHRSFEKVEVAGRYMLELVNDTLDVQKLDAGRLKLEPKLRSCREVLDNLVAMIRPEAEKKGVEFVVENRGAPVDCYAFVDELRLQQIFMNLAGNAIKFTPAGGRVTFCMECTCAETVNGRLVRHEKFQISDTGIGMSKEFIQKHLFRPFAQEQNSATVQYGGSGLGLSIVKQLVELMGGSITAESTLGQGSTFTVLLNVTDADAAEVEAALAAQNHKSLVPNPAALAGRHVLLCEDHPLNAEIAARLLQKAGCVVTVAKNGKEGLDFFAAAQPGSFDVVLMDIRMPVMDGLAATAAIRALERPDAKTVPIIAMTANAYDEDIRHCLAAGMNAHIAKPIDPAVMYATMETALS